MAIARSSSVIEQVELESINNTRRRTTAKRPITSRVVEMNASSHTGKLYEDYYRNRSVLGKVKVKDFAKEFAAVYEQK